MGINTSGTVGNSAEQQALDYLLCRGLLQVSRNFRSRAGEIDLVMMDGDCIVFVEVRYRRSTNFLAPASTVDTRKQRKILRTAALFLSRHKHYAQNTARFDVVAITGDAQREVTWVRDAFRPRDSML